MKLRLTTAIRTYIPALILPIGMLGGLVAFGQVLAWPIWWISLGSVTGSFIVEAVIINLWILKRHKITWTVSTQSSAVSLGVLWMGVFCLLVPVISGYLLWSLPQRHHHNDAVVVINTAVALTELVSTVDPENPTDGINQAAQLIVPDHVEEFQRKIGAIIADKVNNNIAVQAQVLTAGIETLTPLTANVAVVVSSKQISLSSHQTRQVNVPLRVSLIKNHKTWYIADLAPIHQR